jgi:hypothetical protein
VSTVAADPAAPTRRTRALRMPGRETISLVLFFAAVAAFYAFIVGISSPGFSFSRVNSGPYGWLGDALVHGQLNLRYPEVPDQLRALPDPYDPAATDSFRWTLHLHDLSYHDDKLFIYWGVVPALLLFAPLRLAGIWMSQGLAVIILCLGGLVFSVLTLRFLVRRFLPQTPPWALWAGQITLACCNAVPFIMRRAEHSEVAIGGGLCFGFLAIWLFVTAWYGERRSMRRLAGASLALGLAVASRPTWVVLAIVPVVLAVWAWRARRPDSGRLSAALLGPLAVCGLVVMAYNAARFGSPFELGSKYQLAGYRQTDYAMFTPAFLAPGLFFYVLEPPHLTPLFPFLALGPPPNYPGTLPPGYISYWGEPIAGVLPASPVLLLLFLIPLMWRGWSQDLRRIVLVLAGLGVAMVLMLSGVLWSTTERYVVDFASLLLIAALLVWFSALVRLRGRRRRVVAVVVGAALAWGAVLGLAVSFTGYGKPLPEAQPKLWSRLESAFSPVSRVLSGVAGRPVVGRISPPQPAPLITSWSSLGRDPVLITQGAKPTTVRVASPSAGHYVLRALAATGPNVAAGEQFVLGVGTKHGRSEGTVQTGQPTEIAVPVELDAGVTSVVLTARALRATGSPALFVAIRSFERPGEQ